MPGLSFQQRQAQFAQHLRDPHNNAAPAGIELRRLNIYQELIFNNVDGFIASGFPVCSEIIGDDNRQRLTREFLRDHRAESPYFLQISQEFLLWLQRRTGDNSTVELPDFFTELAHYEWVELALDVATEELPASSGVGDVLTQSLQVSPLAWSLSYRYPVHRICRDYQLQEPPETLTYVIAYRDRVDEVRFLETNAITQQLLHVIDHAQGITGYEALLQLAEAISHPDPQVLLGFGQSLLQDLFDKDIVLS